MRRINDMLAASGQASGGRHKRDRDAMSASARLPTGFALDVAARYAQHLAAAGARYTRANPPRRLLTKFVCPNQSVAGKLEVAIKRLSAAEKRKLVGTTGTAARKLLLDWASRVHRSGDQFALFRATHAHTDMITERAGPLP